MAESERNTRGYYDLPVLKTPVWHWEVWSYFFLGGLAAGSFVVASLMTLFGDSRDRALSRAGYLISFGAVLLCPPLLIKDLGRPSRFLNMLRVFKPQSPMSVGVWGLVGFSGVSTGMAFRQAFAETRGPLGGVARALPIQVLAIAGTAIGLLLGSYTGILLSVTSVPLWSRSRWLGPTFLASSVGSGLAATSLALVSKSPTPTSTLRKIERSKLIVAGLEAVALVGYVRATGRAVRPLIDADQCGKQFAAGAVGLGVVIPALAGLTGHHSRRLPLILASLCGLAGGLLLRYALVEGGRYSAEDPGTTFWHTDVRKGR